MPISASIQYDCRPRNQVFPKSDRTVWLWMVTIGVTQSCSLVSIMMLLRTMMPYRPLERSAIEPGTVAIAPDEERIAAPEPLHIGYHSLSEEIDTGIFLSQSTS